MTEILGRTNNWCKYEVLDECVKNEELKNCTYPNCEDFECKYFEEVEE